MLPGGVIQNPKKSHLAAGVAGSLLSITRHKNPGNNAH
jgi:hypothetical protein